MYEKMKIKYLFVNLHYSAYVIVQIVLISMWLIGSIVFYLFAKNSTDWLLSNAWWLCIVIALAEVGESKVAIKKAKKNYTKNQTTEQIDVLNV